MIVDDEPDLVELVAYNLKKEGFEISSSSDGEDAFARIRKENFSLIILDLMLPGIQGLELCKLLKSNDDTDSIPIIMLTAKNEEFDRVLGLEIGADDYVTKPFSPRELVARVKAVLRRARERQVPEAIVQIGDLVITTDAYQVTKRGVPVKLSATEYKILLFLAQRRGKIFSRDMLLDALWKDEAFVEPRTVDVHIRRLRTQIEDDPARPVYIKTRRGIGYYVDSDA